MFIDAAVNGQIEQVRQLLDAKKVHINSADSEGKTALIWAAAQGYKDICELLFSNICGLDVQDKDGMTALIWSAYNGHHEISSLLISNGSDLDAQDFNGWTALMWAAYNGRIPVAISLIEAGCNTLIKNKQGKSVIDILKENQGWSEVAKLQVIHSLNYLFTLFHISFAVPRRRSVTR